MPTAMEGEVVLKARWWDWRMMKRRIKVRIGGGGRRGEGWD